MRKIAAHRVVLPDGTVFCKEVVVVDEDGRILSHRPLRGEEASVEWYPGEVALTDIL